MIRTPAAMQLAADLYESFTVSEDMVRMAARLIQLRVIQDEREQQTEQIVDQLPSRLVGPKDDHAA